MTGRIAGSVMIHPPHLLPWLPFIVRMSLSEIFVVLDTVAFRRYYFHNRTYIGNGRTPAVRCTLPVRRPHNGLLQTTRYLEGNNKRKLFRAIEMTFSRSAKWCDHSGELEKLVLSTESDLVIYNTRLLSFCIDALGLPAPKIVRASSLSSSRDATARIVEICDALGAHSVLCGWGGSGRVHDLTKLERCGVDMRIINHPNMDLCPRSALIEVFGQGLDPTEMRNVFRQAYK